MDSWMFLTIWFTIAMVTGGYWLAIKEKKKVLTAILYGLSLPVFVLFLWPVTMPLLVITYHPKTDSEEAK